MKISKSLSVRIYPGIRLFSSNLDPPEGVFITPFPSGMPREKNRSLFLIESASIEFMAFAAERWQIMIFFILMTGDAGFAFGYRPQVRGMAVIAEDPRMGGIFMQPTQRPVAG